MWNNEYVSFLYMTTSQLPFGKPIAKEEDASRLELGSDFKDAPCLFNAEVSLMLQQKQQEYDSLKGSDLIHGQLKPLSNAFQQSLKYVTTFSRFHSREMTLHVRKLIASSGLNLAEFEMAQLANLCTENSEEAKTLIPSLQGKVDDDALQSLLDQLDSARKFQN